MINWNKSLAGLDIQGRFDIILQLLSI